MISKFNTKCAPQFWVPSLLIAGTWFAAQQESQPAEAPVVSPYSRQAQDSHRLESDIRRHLEGELEKVNGIGESRKGKVFVQEETFERMMVFVPIDEDHTVDRGTFPREIPPGSVTKKWTDTYALAQEQSFHYEWIGVENLTQTLIPLTMEATVSLKYTVRQRLATAGKPSPLPTTPKGLEAWPTGKYLTARGGRKVSRLGILIKTPLPPGESAPLKNSSPLAEEAMAKLELTEVKISESKATGHVRYDFDLDQWVLTSIKLEKVLPGPGLLSWGHLVATTTDRDWTVLDPRWFERKGK